MFENQVIAFNNQLTNWRRVRVKPHQLLVLAPHCLQRKSCQQDALAAIENCRRCGQCRCGNLLDLQETYGVRVHLAGGGSKALDLAGEETIHAIVAVACARELRAGILAAFPKPVFAICNRQPHGPCRDTDVCPSEVETVVRILLGLEEDSSEP